MVNRIRRSGGACGWGRLWRSLRVLFRLAGFVSAAWNHGSQAGIAIVTFRVANQRHPSLVG